MNNMTTSMWAALVAVGRQGKAWVGGAYPNHNFTLYDHHGIDLQGRSLIALWKRGLICFEVHARLTTEGKIALKDDIRMTPGKRDFSVVEK